MMETKGRKTLYSMAKVAINDENKTPNRTILFD
jgi:hypothetical protein